MIYSNKLQLHLVQLVAKALTGNSAALLLGQIFEHGVHLAVEAF